MALKFHPQIILYGENIKPREWSYNNRNEFCFFSQSDEKGDWDQRFGRYRTLGRAVIDVYPGNNTRKSIEDIIKYYEKITEKGEEKLGIEKKEFILFIETETSLPSVTLDSKALALITSHFTELQISFIPASRKEV
ncbi:MAG: hypothetical protein GX297_03520 [Treponema sp.]|nr:hypothetical protein [Treponema sp.]